MQIFPRQLNLLPLILGGLGAAAGPVVIGAVWYYGSPLNLQVGYTPEQPVPYSHALHAGELGLDCRYCHSSVESSQEAVVPPTQTCMGCHSVVQNDSARLEVVRQSWETGDAIPWVRVHKVPEHVYFDHSAHVTAGVGCVSCHGRIDQLPQSELANGEMLDVVGVQEGIAMGWCLDCHRDPVPNLRPRDRVTDMDWEPDEAWRERQAQMQQVWDSRRDDDAHWQDPAYREQAGVSEDIVADLVNPPEHCSGCHR